MEYVKPRVLSFSKEDIKNNIVASEYKDNIETVRAF